MRMMKIKMVHSGLLLDPSRCLLLDAPAGLLLDLDGRPNCLLPDPPAELLRWRRFLQSNCLLLDPPAELLRWRRFLQQGIKLFAMHLETSMASR